MGEEAFYKTLNRELFYTENFYKIIRRTENEKFITLANDIIYAFEIYGAFLNVIPLKDREGINKNIIKWISNIYDNFYIEEENTKIHKRAIDAKNSDLRTIQNMKNILVDTYADESAAIKKIENDKIVDVDVYTVDVFHFLDKLYRDIENNTYSIVSKSRYYKRPLTDKTRIKRIIEEAISTYNIKKCVKNSETLIARLTTQKNY